MDDYEVDYERSCPKCGYSPVHHRDCTELSCDDGYIDEYDHDAINFYQVKAI